MPDYLTAVRKKLEKQGVSEDEIKETLKKIEAEAKLRKAGPAGSATSSNEEALKKENLRLAAENHEWKIKYRELQEEFRILKEESASNTPAPFFDSPGVADSEKIETSDQDTLPDFLKE